MGIIFADLCSSILFILYIYQENNNILYSQGPIFKSITFFVLYSSWYSHSKQSDWNLLVQHCRWNTKQTHLLSYVNHVNRSFIPTFLNLSVHPLDLLNVTFNLGLPRFYPSQKYIGVQTSEASRFFLTHFNWLCKNMLHDLFIFIEKQRWFKSCSIVPSSVGRLFYYRWSFLLYFY